MRSEGCAAGSLPSHEGKRDNLYFQLVYLTGELTE